MHTCRLRLVFVLLLGSFCLNCLACADMTDEYFGTLSGDSIENTKSGWDGASIEWGIQQNADNSWHYEYNVSVPKYDISHIIIEVTPNATLEDFYNFNGSFNEAEIGWMQNPGSPNLPENIYGIKFESIEDNTNWYMSFDSNRSPVWGDFYAKDGKPGGEMWNVGFTNNDIDNSSNHIMRPNGDAAVPEPASSAMVLIGLAGIAIKKKYF
jgi:hypothetical protein